MEMSQRQPPHTDASDVYETQAQNINIGANNREVVLNFGSPTWSMSEGGGTDIDAIEYDTRVHLDKVSFAELCQLIDDVREEMDLEIDAQDTDRDDPPVTPGVQ